MNSFDSNFNLFPKDYEIVFSNQIFNQKGGLKRAIEEVNLNTPDSIAIAIKLLNDENIVLDSLNELDALHSQGQVRDENFARKSNDLKNKVLEEIYSLIHL